MRRCSIKMINTIARTTASMPSQGKLPLKPLAYVLSTNSHIRSWYGVAWATMVQQKSSFCPRK
jgi:hypothetical protein